jgi:hypothetical protein
MHSADVEDQTDLGGDGVAQNVRFGEKLKNWRGPLVRPGDFHRYLPVREPRGLLCARSSIGQSGASGLGTNTHTAECPKK